MQLEQKWLCNKEDLDALREKHLPNSAPEFRVAIVRHELGNFDNPVEIMLFAENDMSSPAMVCTFPNRDEG
tara:strand:- start:1509 stop:1721 length:213 start_codon:yes stop_codon:yes gene_type:complete